MITRREFLKGAAGLSLAGLTGCSGSFSAEDVRLRELTSPLPKGLEDFHGYKIAFLSDIHQGPFLPPAWFEASIACSFTLNPERVPAFSSAVTLYEIS